MDERERTDGEIEPAGVEPGARRRLLGRLGLAVLWIAGLSLGLAALALVGLAALVAHGPVEVATAARTAEVLLADGAGPDGRATVGGARLDWSWEEGLAVDLSDIYVERAGILAMRVPRARVLLRLTPILTGSVHPRTLVLIDPHLLVDTAGLAGAGMAAAAPEAAGATPAPTTAPAVDAPAGSVVALPTMPGTARPLALAARPLRAVAEAREVGRAVDRLVARARAEGIERFTVRNGVLEMRRTDATGLDRHVAVPEIEAEAVVDGPAGELDVGYSARGEVGRWSMRLTATRGDDGRRRLAFVADDVSHRDLFGPPGPAFELGMPLYPRLTLHYGAEDRYEGAEFDLRLGAGVFRFGPLPEDAMIVDEGQLQIDWKADADRLDVRNLYVAVGETGMTLHGLITPPTAEAGLWGVRLDVDGGGLRPRDVPGKPLTVGGGFVEARIDAAARTIDITRGEVDLGGGRVRAAGRIDFSGVEPRMKLDLGFSPLDTDQIKRAWPHWVAPDARDWFIRNVDAGRVQDLAIQLDMPRFDRPETWPGNAFRMSCRFDGARFRAFGNLPPVVGGDGRVTIADRRLEVALDRAQIATKAAKRPSLDSLRFAVLDVFAKPPKATIRLQVAGDVTSLAEVANAEPLAILDEAGIKAEGLVGTATVTSQIDVVFEKTIRPGSIDYRVDATLDRFSSPHPIQGRKFQDGKFRILADPRGVKVTGRAQIDGVVADVDMYDARGGSKSSDKRDFKMVLDDAARQRVGLDLGDMVHGAIGLAVAQPNPADPKRRVEVDLTPARLVLSHFGWSKGAGVPAKAALDLVEDDKGIRLENLVIESEGLAIAGTVVLDKERRIVSADFGRFALRKGDVAKLRIGRAADQAFAVTFDAQSFDLRGVMQAGRRPGGDEPAASTSKSNDMVLKLRAARLIGFNDIVLTDAGLDGRYRAGAFSTLQLSARSSGGRSLSASIKPEGGHRRLVVTAEDGGSFLSFLDFFDRVGGGRLAMNAQLGAPGVAQGLVRLDDFRLLEEPKAGRLAPQQTADGVKQIKVRRVEINPQTDFSRSSVRFSMRDGVVTVTEGLAKGTTVGATASGQLDLNNQRINLTGTYIPAFGLNNLAGRIPVFGAITGAGSNEGLVGVTFRVFGGIEDPILEINPLSAIAPGIFRRIFEFQKDDRPAPPAAGNAPTRITP